MEENYYSKGRKQIGFLSFFRDVLIASFPIPSNLVAKLIPYPPDFIFLTHPRNNEDILATFPFLRILNKIIPYSIVRKLLDLAPCYIVSNVNAPKGKRGYVISVVELPERMFASRQLTQKLIKGCDEYFKKICSKKTYVGLAAWWPIVSNAGQAFNVNLKENDLVKITNGHTATLTSIYLSILRTSEIIGIPLAKLRLLVIGVGKVGGALCQMLASKVEKIGLVDKNKMRLQVLKKQVEKINPKLHIETILIEESNGESIILNELQKYDLSVCTTSNTDLLISDANCLRSCIIFDDSRPEAFPRVFSKERKVVVLEGGLMKIPGVSMDSDFGFGQNENIFGCLSEAIILALDEHEEVKPNVGELDFDNLHRLIEFCRKSGIAVGDFKCAHQLIQEEDLVSLSNQKNNITA